MDPRKIQFLIAMQREIDKVELREGESSTRVERLKSRFYDVVEVADVVGNGETLQTPENNSKKDSIHISLPEVSGSITSELEYWTDFVDSLGDDISKLAVSEENIQKLLQHKTFQNNEPDKLTEGFPHKPKDVADFMNLFDDAEGFKYLTHDFDAADQRFSVNDFLKQAKIIFDSQTRKYIIPKSLWGIINQFAFQSKPEWFGVGGVMTEGWSSPKWIEWSETEGLSPSSHPAFNKIVQAFKELTRVKSLPKLIDSVIDKKFGDRKREFNFVLIELDKADFYTHVGRFSFTLGHLFDEICNRSDFPTITIQLERQNIGDYRHRILHIYHHDSYPENKLMEEVFEKYTRQHGGHLWEIREKLFGYCDWYIETVWDKKPVRIHLLREGMKTNQSTTEVEFLDSITRPGFTHTFTFYSL